MTEKTITTLQDCLAGAFQALLMGDSDERDKLCAMAERTFAGCDSVSGDTPIIMGTEDAV